MASTKVAVAAALAVLCAVAAVMIAPTAAQPSQVPSPAVCMPIIQNITECFVKLDPTETTSTECCSQIKETEANQPDCLCNIYLGFKLYLNGTVNAFNSTVKDCGITTDFSSACSKMEKQIGNNGAGNNIRSGDDSGSGSDKGAAEKIANAGVYASLLIIALMMFSRG